ncbi:MAG TPA: mechanosensitive ion channel family protein [Nitrospiraceae bacterium]|nr:mechanosensitive ion channel family protein [Nitrospiraceae bacterium]
MDGLMSLPNLVLGYVVRYGFQVLGAVVILAAGAFLARWAGTLTHQWLERQDLEPPVKLLLIRITKLVVLAFALLVALDQLGFQIAPLIAGLGVAGLGIGLALQGVLSNVVAGLSIIFTKPYRVGEHIALLGVHGDVVKIDIFTTTLLHPDRSRVVIPNRKIVGEILHNFGSIRQLDLSVGISYDTDINQAQQAVRELVNRHPHVMKEPKPIIGITGFADSAVTLSIKPWVGISHFEAAQAELNQAILERFRRDNIVIPFPQHDVRLLKTL